MEIGVVFPQGGAHAVGEMVPVACDASLVGNRFVSRRSLWLLQSRNELVDLASRVS